MGNPSHRYILVIKKLALMMESPLHISILKKLNKDGIGVEVNIYKFFKQRTKNLSERDIRIFLGDLVKAGHIYHSPDYDDKGEPANGKYDMKNSKLTGLKASITVTGTDYFLNDRNRRRQWNLAILTTFLLFVSIVANTCTNYTSNKTTLLSLQSQIDSLKKDKSLQPAPLLKPAETTKHTAHQPNKKIN